MAKRRKLEAPSADDLSRIEAQFRRETPGGPGMAPIAQIASETAKNMDVVSPEQRQAAAELDRYRNADKKGLVVREIPLAQINVSALTRDRISLDPEAFAELKQSIAKNGLRMPIEVYELPKGQIKRFGLISGYRRFLAVKENAVESGQGPTLIAAMVRPAQEENQLTEAMIEENEIRAALTHFERGRISVLSVQSGADIDVEAAVNRLFGFASKAKRSKIRSFATIYEELGDVLAFPKALKERQGLKLAAALKTGQGGALREALARATPADPASEWVVLERALVEPQPNAEKTGGRPKKAYKYLFTTSGGAEVKWADTRGKNTLEIAGDIDPQKAEKLVAFMTDLL